MATVFCPTTDPASAPTRGAIATESCRLHRIALARRSGKIAGIAGVGAGTSARRLPGRPNDVCGSGDIADDLQPNFEWRVEIADELGEALFKLLTPWSRISSGAKNSSTAIAGLGTTCSPSLRGPTLLRGPIKKIELAGG
jgi:hypothetical protein